MDHEFVGNVTGEIHVLYLVVVFSAVIYTK